MATTKTTGKNTKAKEAPAAPAAPSAPASVSVADTDIIKAKNKQGQIYEMTGTHYNTYQSELELVTDA